MGQTTEFIKRKKKERKKRGREEKREKEMSSHSHQNPPPNVPTEAKATVDECSSQVVIEEQPEIIKQETNDESIEDQNSLSEREDESTTSSDDKVEGGGGGGGGKIADSATVEAFLAAFEEEIRCKNKESQCSYMEAYGFVVTFRFVYEQEVREKESETALNALLSQYTGIESLNVLQVFLESLNGELDEFMPLLKPIDCILLTYMQLKICISFKDLAKVFECEECIVCTCFLATLNKIKKSLGSVIYWPSREETEVTIPKFFKPAYSNVRTIFTNLLVQISPTFTKRYVIGFAPSGFVSYISKGYNATTHTDERIFRDEKIRQRFERNQDALMVMQGFPIENLLGINNFRVFRPPFLVKTILPDNKSRVYENSALYKHVLGLTTIFDKFYILNTKNLSTTFVEEIVFSVAVCINYNVMFRNT